MNNLRMLFVIFFAVLCFASAVSAQPTSTQEAGGILRQEADIERQNVFGRRVQLWNAKDKKDSKIVEEQTEDRSGSPRVIIQNVNVEGVQLVSSADVNGVIQANFTPGQEMTFNQMQELAGQVTALYREKGFVTSRAYIPPQNLNEGNLTIKVLEGRMGKYTISGNKHFTTKQLDKKFRLKSGEVFDYNTLQRSLEYINEHPDREAKVVLLPGQEPGTTDVDVKVQDRAPVHATLEYDNWASRYLNQDRYAVTLEHNNLTKHDDRLSLKFLMSEGDALEVFQGRYVHPITNTLEIGGHFIASQSELGRELAILDAHGSADVIGIFAKQEVANTTDFKASVNAGFDHKNVKNYLLGVESSSDKVRMIRIGGDVDYDDAYGRSIANLEWDFGIPNILEGMQDENDPLASRSGAGGEFDKGLLNFFRLQPLPSNWKHLNESYLLWKNFAQYSDDVLVASEQFQIGGPTSVRGYAPGELSGDSGIYSAIEWSFPIYGMSRDIKFPKREEKLYDALRLVAFYDWGWVDLERPQVGEEEDSTLKGFGAGIRLNLSSDIAARIEVGWPDGRKSTDGHRDHVWVEFDWKF